MSSTRRILYGTVLITVFTTMILAALRLVSRAGLDILTLPLSFVAGTAIGGAGAMRRQGGRWPEPVLAGLASAILLLFVLRVAFPGLGPISPGTYPGAARDYAKSVLIYLVIGGAGAFVLPLFDPAVRRGGPAPSPYKVFLAALAIVALLFVAELVTTRAWGGLGYANFGLGVLVGGSVGALIVAGLGLLLTLVGARDMGAWAGGLGLMVASVTVIVWTVTGMRWFP